MPIVSCVLRSIRRPLHVADKLINSTLTPSNRMKLLFRIVVAVLVAISVFYFLFWIGAALTADSLPDSMVTFVPIVVAGAAAALASRLVWKQTRNPHGLLNLMVMGGLLVGTIGFCGGFFGPMIFSPESNQGPMLGLLITGPLGVVLGTIGGAIYWFVKMKRSPTLSQGTVTT